MTRHDAMKEANDLEDELRTCQAELADALAALDTTREELKSARDAGEVFARRFKLMKCRAETAEAVIIHMDWPTSSERLPGCTVAHARWRPAKELSKEMEKVFAPPKRKGPPIATVTQYPDREPLAGRACHHGDPGGLAARAAGRGLTGSAE